MKLPTPPRLQLVEPGKQPQAVVNGGLLYAEAREAVDKAAVDDWADYDCTEPVRFAAAQLAARWWAAAAGYGIGRELLSLLPSVALGAVVIVDQRRQVGAPHG